ncbi:LacI family DNA-binding transcriptional regulator [Subtercola sp. RTI3]|uniref:LacI family DNA-binding transcriptional regulator n=1 Tax=Subtercola sp. RTI3 TaxID=3048639 RepID=UPI002B22BFA0|nr:LacI family DNA-binding transcriptional regulator [Subtercola sp. RTI3]MEA9983853.1 LacI family DNA-binding transcriptional regulator [Subtercola sp. RTI3]
MPASNTVRRRTVTIHDVALAAGVATSTVSRALSNPERVRASTREHVGRIASELGYLPPSAAKSKSLAAAAEAGLARARRSGTPADGLGVVALLVPDIGNPFLTEIIRGSQRQLAAAGYLQVLVDTEESGDVEWQTLQKLLGTVDGVVLTASRLTDEQLITVAARVPLVVLNRETPGVASTIVDTPTGFEALVEHLVSLGHRSLLYVSGPAESWSNTRRLAAVQRAGERLGVDVAVTRPFRPTRESGVAAADTAINSGATACIAYNDLLAIGILGRLAERGVAVPAEMSVVGCDDIFGTDFCSPALTTIAAPIEQAGRAAVSLLLGLFDPSAAPRRQAVTIGTHLVIRHSTGPAPIGGHDA